VSIYAELNYFFLPNVKQCENDDPKYCGNDGYSKTSQNIVAFQPTKRVPKKAIKFTIKT